MAEYLIWLNGDYIPRNQAKISMLDRGFRLGDVVFDTERTFNGKVFKLRDHLERLYNSLQYMRIDPNMTIDDMEQLTLDVVHRNEPNRTSGDDYMITQIVTRGQADSMSPNPGGAKVAGHMKANVSIWIDPIDFVSHSRLYREGGHVVIPKTRALSSDQVDAKVKHFNRLHFVLAQMEVADVDPQAFPVLLDTNGNLSESTGFNFFMISNGMLRTPGDQNILQGITRTTILEMANQLRIPFTCENTLQPYDAYTADEAFLCNTPSCIIPIVKVDNRTIGDGSPGKMTQQLMAACDEIVGLNVVDQANRRSKDPQ